MATAEDRLHLKSTVIPRLLNYGLPALGEYRKTEGGFKGVHKVHVLVHVPQSLKDFGSGINTAMESAEALNTSLQALGRHTAGGFAAMYSQLTQRVLENNFFIHDLPRLRGVATPVLPFSVRPPLVSQKLNHWAADSNDVPTAAFCALWSAAAAAGAEGVSTQICSI